MYVCEIREGQRVEVVFDASLSGRLKKKTKTCHSASLHAMHTHTNTHVTTRIHYTHTIWLSSTDIDF